MIYSAELNSSQSIEIESQGSQTRIALRSHGVGSQQSQSSSFSTGGWTAQPTLHRAPDGFVLRVHTAQGTRTIRIRGGEISLLDIDSAPQRSELQAQGEITLRESNSHTEPMKPMETMKPMGAMKMGDMEMKPGEMRMGSMRMSLSEERNAPQPAPEPAPAAAPAPAQPQVLESASQAHRAIEAPAASEAQARRGRFCTQCGERAQAEDRFCHACGHRLRALD